MPLILFLIVFDTLYSAFIRTHIQNFKVTLVLMRMLLDDFVDVARQIEVHRVFQLSSLKLLVLLPLLGVARGEVDLATAP